MQIYLFWGEDDFAMAQAVTSLRQTVLDPNWASFNYDKIIADSAGAVVEGLDRALTPPFGTGSRFVWLANTTVTQQCSQELLAQLERTLPVIPPTTVLLLTSIKKPDSRLKSTKLLVQSAQVREFSPIPPWNDKELAQRVRQVAGEMNVKLTATAIELLAESIGSDTRQLYSETRKIAAVCGQPQPTSEPGRSCSTGALSRPKYLPASRCHSRGQYLRRFGFIGRLNWPQRAWFEDCGWLDW